MKEADKVAAQLNEFINYSRPREVRRTAVSIPVVAAEVARTLITISKEKIVFANQSERLRVEADEQMLRQALFNLILNAIQAADGDGDIQVVAEKRGPTEASLEIRDNGPGFLPEQRAEIFKPYFTTQKTALAWAWLLSSKSCSPTAGKLSACPTSRKAPCSASRT